MMHDLWWLSGMQVFSMSGSTRRACGWAHVAFFFGFHCMQIMRMGEGSPRQFLPPLFLQPHAPFFLVTACLALAGPEPP
jgi:hypothetical protein